jgi:hypothetical protein
MSTAGQKKGIFGRVRRKRGSTFFWDSRRVVAAVPLRVSAGPIDVMSLYRDHAPGLGFIITVM